MATPRRGPLVAVRRPGNAWWIEASKVSMLDGSRVELPHDKRQTAGICNLKSLAEGDVRRKIQAGPQLRDGSRIGVITYQKSGSSPSVSGTMSPGLRGSLSLKRTFSESTAETPSSR